MTKAPTFRDLKAVLHLLPARDRAFAESVMQTVISSGYRACTPRQSQILREIYGRATAAKTETAPVPVNVGSMARIVDLFAKVDLKKPKLRIRDTNGVTYSITPSSKNPGSLAVFEDKAERGFRGTITAEGRYTYREAKPETVEALRRFACDPVSAAKLYGSETGSCCFCARDLTDPQSVAVGYGPICADKWGLPHGGLDLKPAAIEGSELAEAFGLPIIAKPALGTGPKPWEGGR